LKAIIVRSPQITKKDDQYLNSIVDETDSPNDAQIILAAGGDSAILESIHELYAHSMAFYGINFGRVGFLSNRSRPKNKKEFEMLIENAKAVDLKSVQATIKYVGCHTKQVVTGFNDIWISPKCGQALRMNLTIGDRALSETVVGDGIIVSTPQGSTGYTRSAGGKIIKPDLPVLQITPKACTIGKRRAVWKSSFIEKDDTVIRVNFEDSEFRPAAVYYDNKAVTPQDTIEYIEFRKSKYGARLLFDSSKGFYDKIFQLETGEE